MDVNHEVAIRLKDVRKSFDGKEFVLKGIDLDIIKGEITAIIGFSGTGKSVLLKHILGLLKPTSGCVEVLGEDIAKMGVEELIEFRQHFGVLFQNAALFDDMTVMDNVLFPLNEHQRNKPIQKRREKAEARLKQVGLEEKHFDKLPAELSGGMRKRVGLARAIALDPELMLYDEPTTGLHFEDVKKLLGVLDRLVEKGNSVYVYGEPKDFFESDNELVQKFVAKGVHK